MLKGFKEFVLRGNVLDLAVAVVIGGAFGKIVAGLGADLLMPLVALVGGKPDFSAINFTVHGAVFKPGDFLNDVVAFLMVATAIYFFVAHGGIVTVGDPAGGGAVFTLELPLREAAPHG